VLIREGYTAQEAINLIREKRSKHALFNGRFAKWLLDVDVEAWRNYFATSRHKMQESA